LYFLPFTKAFDSVHRESLWHIARLLLLIFIIIIKIVHEVQKDRIRQKKGQNNQHVHK